VGYEYHSCVTNVKQFYDYQIACKFFSNLDSDDHDKFPQANNVVFDLNESSHASVMYSAASNSNDVVSFNIVCDNTGMQVKSRKCEESVTSD
jgi:hypothetical protein